MTGGKFLTRALPLLSSTLPHFRRQFTPLADGKFFTRALPFLSPTLPHFRRLSTRSAAAGGNLKHSPENSASVLHFLRGRGVDDEVLAGFTPQLLNSKAGKKLPAKFDLLLTLGFSEPEAAKVLRMTGLLRSISLISLRRRLDALRTIISDDADVLLIINRYVWVLGSARKTQRMAENVSKLRGLGVSDAKIKSLLVSQPRFFVQAKPQRIDEAADRAEAEFGFRRNSGLFLYAVKVLSMMSESTMESKFRVFERLGWERSGVTALFKAYPSIVTLADATLVKKLSFFMNKVGLDPSCIVKKPAILGYSLEKRVRPRFDLVNAFKSKDLLPNALRFIETWCITEAEFMEKYVVKYMKQEPAICDAYINAVASAMK